MNSQEAFDHLKSILNKNQPHILLRLGMTETGYMDFWMRENNLNEMFVKSLLSGQSKHWLECTGFFPVEKNYIERFLNLYAEIIYSISKTPFQATYMETKPSEVLDNVFKKCTRLEQGLNPFYNNPIFQSELKDKKLCIVTCFPESFKKQCNKLELLFDDKRLVNLNPKNITFVKSPPHKFISTEKENRFSNWFEALDQMTEDITHSNYEILLTSCGAYSLPLCYHAFKSNKIAFNLGGGLQLLFGIKGKRWNDPFYKFNEHWISPLKEETPQEVNKVEDGCYW